VNNGNKKSHGDVQKKNIWNSTASEKKEYMINNGKSMPPDSTEIILNCYYVDETEIQNNPDKLGEYNVSRYLAAFNKRIEPLLVVFHPNIRDEILIEDPKNRPFFTKSQTELVRGYPRKDGDQDTLDEVLTISDTEVDFWLNTGIDPFYMYVNNTIELVDAYYVNKNKNILIEKS
jgi:hypothetical protein